jgi:hypothetical protein
MFSMVYEVIFFNEATDRSKQNGSELAQKKFIHLRSWWVKMKNSFINKCLKMVGPPGFEPGTKRL